MARSAAAPDVVRPSRSLVLRAAALAAEPPGGQAGSRALLRGGGEAAGGEGMSDGPLAHGVGAAIRVEAEVSKGVGEVILLMRRNERCKVPKSTQTGVGSASTAPDWANQGDPSLERTFSQQWRADARAPQRRRKGPKHENGVPA